MYQLIEGMSKSLLLHNIIGAFVPGTLLFFYHQFQRKQYRNDDTQSQQYYEQYFIRMMAF
jgi:hypothetical protein